MPTNNEPGGDQTIRSISITRVDGAAVTVDGRVEENPNGSISVHDANGDKMIYLKGEYKEWHFAQNDRPAARAGR